MQAALELFQANIQRSRDLTAVFQAMDTQTTQALDLTDILRASLVMSVSTLDYFIHEITRLGILEAYRGERGRTTAFLRFQVTLESAIAASMGRGFEVWLENEVRERHSYQSFQMPDRIADALRLVSDLPLWDSVSARMGLTRQEVIDRLTLIVQRRNKIAHEADIMPDHAGQTVHSDLRSPIDEPMVDQAINFIASLAETIHELVSLVGEEHTQAHESHT